MKLSKNHIFFTSAFCIDEICNSLKKDNICFFSYGIFWDNGDCIYLSNRSDVIEYLFENEYQLTTPIENEFIKKNFYFLIPSNGSYKKILHESMQYFKIYNPIDIIKRYNNYYELFCFAMNKDKTDVSNFYLNNINYLENFTLYFKRIASKIIDDVKKQKIQLLPHMRSNIKGDHHEKFSIKSNQFPTANFTAREIDCLRYIAKGYTAKECAKELQLSNRTIEHYIENLKSKINCSKKSDIIKLIHNQYTIPL